MTKTIYRSAQTNQYFVLLFYYSIIISVLSVLLLMLLIKLLVSVICYVGIHSSVYSNILLYVTYTIELKVKSKKLKVITQENAIFCLSLLSVISKANVYNNSMKN